VSTHLLEVRHLAKRYRGRQVVADASLALRSGQIVGLLGPNGAGKTTCFYMIIGLVPADGGQVLLDAIDLSAAPMHERARLGMGYLPQEASVFRKLSVADNILAILETRADLDVAGRQAELETLLQEFGLAPLRQSLGMSLSGGERRRVEIARALASNPAFLLLDEPFAGVDPISVNEIKHIVRGLSQRGIGLLITDHNVRETLDLCEYAYIVNAGRILAEGSPAAILEHPQVKAVYLGDNFRM
jgi:lipopolysaccharide export system ATP-binding protein